MQTIANVSNRSLRVNVRHDMRHHQALFHKKKIKWSFSLPRGIQSYPSLSKRKVQKRAIHGQTKHQNLAPQPAKVCPRNLANVGWPLVYSGGLWRVRFQKGSSLPEPFRLKVSTSLSGWGVATATLFSLTVLIQPPSISYLLPLTSYLLITSC